MSFSAEWLALREPVDHRSVNRDLAAAVAARFDGPDHVSIMDLGCGAGSNLRGSHALFPDSQHWTLVDHDPALLAAARQRLAAWADEASEAGEELLLVKGEKHLMIDFRQMDLTRDLERALDWRPDVVTAAALFDLVSAAWLERFVAALAARGLPLYTVLTYDGREDWQPPHAADAAVLAAFNLHQKTDKGFGPSAGPDATALMARLFKKAGYHVTQADSPWVLGGADRALTDALTSGIAAAARETGRVPPEDLTGWLAAKRDAAHGTVGHQDLFARPNDGR
jgi:SAM-dependent methyltransferase